MDDLGDTSINSRIRFFGRGIEDHREMEMRTSTSTPSIITAILQLVKQEDLVSNFKLHSGGLMK